MNIVYVIYFFDLLFTFLPVTETAPPIGEMSKLELLRNQLKNDMPLHDLETLNETASLARNVCTIVDQIKHLRSAIEKTIELSKVKGEKPDGLYDCENVDFILVLYNYSIIVL